MTHHDLQSKTFVITFYIQRSRCVWIRSVQTLPRFTMDGLSRLVVSYYTWGLFVRILIIDINIINDFLEGSLDYAILDAQNLSYAVGYILLFEVYFVLCGRST